MAVVNVGFEETIMLDRGLMSNLLCLNVVDCRPLKIWLCRIQEAERAEAAACKEIEELQKESSEKVQA